MAFIGSLCKKNIISLIVTPLSLLPLLLLWPYFPVPLCSTVIQELFLPLSPVLLLFLSPLNPLWSDLTPTILQHCAQQDHQ